ncbi:MAG: hypothetical protein ACETVS_00090 [Dehalococcoidales bacterium]
MATYLIHQSELKIIQEALAEYQTNHCGTDCPSASKCTNFSFCLDMVGDIALGSIIRIEFYENNPVLNDFMEQLAKLNQHQPRWQNNYDAKI